MYGLKLITDCTIHGLVYGETEKIFLDLDQIDVSLIDEKSFREYLSFKAQSIDSRIGFTMGGFIPYKKTTLLSVSFRFA